MWTIVTLMLMRPYEQHSDGCCCIFYRLNVLNGNTSSNELLNEMPCHQHD